MSISQVGSPTANGAAGTSWTVNLPQVATAGNVIIVSWGYSKGSTGNPTIAISGATLLGSFQGTSGILSGGAGMFALVASGGETSVTLTSSASITLSWIAEEWTGIDTSVFPVGPTPPATYTSDTNGASHTITSNTRVASADGELVFTVLGGRGPTSGAVLTSFGGGATGDYTTASGRVGYVYTANQVVTTGGTSVTHTAVISNSQGSNVNVIGSVSFKATAPVTATVTMSGAGTLAASGHQQVPAVATMVGAGALSVSGRQDVPATVSMAGSGSVAVSGRQDIPAEVSMAGTGTLAASGINAVPAASTLVGSGTLTVDGRLSLPTTVAFQGAGTLEVSGLQEIPTMVTIAGTGTLMTAGLQTVPSTAVFAGIGTLTTAVGGSVSTEVTLAGSGTLAATALIEHPETLLLAGAGELAVAGLVVHLVTVALAGTGTLATSGHVEKPAVLTLAGSGSLLAATLLHVVSSLQLAGVGTMAADGEVVTPPPTRNITVKAVRPLQSRWSARSRPSRWTVRR